MSILAESVDVVIGVDPHKHTHTAAVIAADTGKHHGSRTAGADPDGFAELLAFVTSHEGSRCWVIEGCGSWGRGLATWLQANGEDVREIDSPRRPARRMGKKTDDLDALRVAREALSREDLATPRNSGDRDAIAALLVARRSAVEMTGDTERQLVSVAATCPEALAERLRGKSTAQIVVICARWRPTGDPSIAGTAEAMRGLARRVRDLRAEAEAHQARIEQLVKAWRPDLLELVGVGPHRRRHSARRLVPPGPSAQRRRLRHARRSRATPGLIRDDHPTPPQPARRPAPQLRPAHRRHPATAPRPRHEGLLRAPPL